MNRRDFLANGLTIAGAMVLTGCRGFEAAEHRYKLASESILPADIAKTPAEVRQDYPSAIAKRDTTLNTANPVFDRRSLVKASYRQHT